MSTKIVGKIKLHKASPSSSQQALTTTDLELVRHASLSHIQKGIIDHTISCFEEVVLDKLLFQLFSRGRAVTEIAALAGS